MLEFVRKNAVGKAFVQEGVIGIEEKHLVSVGIFVGEGMVFICRGIVTRNAGANAACVENVDMLIPIDTGRPLGAKEGARGRIDLGFKGIHEFLHIIFIDLDAILYPEIRVIGDVLQGCVDFKIIVSADVRCPKSIGITNLTGGSGSIHCEGDVANSLQSAGNFEQVIWRNNGVLQSGERIHRYLVYRRAFDDNGRTGG